MAADSVGVRTPTVFVVQEDPKKNMTQALDFGNVELVLSKEDEQTFLNTPRIIEKIRYGLRNMLPNDYLILVGNPVSIGLAMIVASEKTGGQFRVLRWDQQDKRYIPITINVGPYR